MKKTIHSLFGLLLALVINAQSSRLESFTIEDGLSQGMIFDILQTKDGFLWIATKDGLNRYDGYNFKVFTNDAFDPFSLAQNGVTALFEDSRGLLWLGLDSKGLDVFDPGTGRFHHFTLDIEREVIVHGTEVRRITELPDGSICALKLGVGLVRIEVPNGWKNGLPEEAQLEKLSKPTLISVKTDVNAQVSPEAILDMNLLQNGTLLATSNHRQFLVEPQKNTYKTINPGLVPIGTRWMAQGDEAFGGDLWVGQGSEIRRLRAGQIKAFVPSGDFCIITLSKGKKGHVWLSLCGKLWDLEPGEDPDFSKPDLTVDALITCVEQDRNGNIWLGTAGYGLRKLNAVSRLFNTGGQGISPSGLWRNTDGRYFGKENSTIKEYFPTTGQFAKASFFSKTPLDQLSLAFEPDGSIWLLCKAVSSSKAAMLKQYTPDGRLVKTFAFGGKIGNFDNLLRLSNGKLFVGTGDCRLVSFDPTNEHFEYFSFAHLFKDKASGVRIVALAEGENGMLWVGTQFGLVKCVPTADGFDYHLIEANQNKRDGLNNNSISCILPDPTNPDKTLWLGTKGGGINRMDIKTGKVRHITTADGLLNDVVYSVLPSNREGEFWCSTNRGLARLIVRKTEPFEFSITTFTAALGLQDNEFNTNAYFKADNGELLFGGINGINRFFPDNIRTDTIPPSVFITGIEINYQKSNIACPENTRELALKHAQNNLSFEFAALDFTDPAKNRYRYRLVGLDEDWVETGSLRFAHFTHLAPGKYEFRVQGSNGESAWREAANPIVVIINPPWWQSKLAYYCYIVLVIWAVRKAYKIQIQRVKEREQLAFEHRETKRIKELEQMKTNFFSNVTHEFRTPLTLIIEPLRQLLKNPDDPDLTEKIRLAEKNSQRLLGMVNQLLDMAKLEGNSMTLDLRSGDFEQTVRGVFEAFQPLAVQRNIQLVLLVPDSIPPLDFDKDKTEIVLNNLISNALKFTPTGGHIQVDIGIHKYSDGLYTDVFVAVKDTGIGIPTDALDKVFDRFYQVDDSHTRVGEGTGIGLALSKELAKLMRGDITVESKVGEGSTFTFWFPLLQKTASGHIGYLFVKYEPEIAFEESAPTRRPVSGEKPVVLIVEDNVDLRKFIGQSVSTAWQVVEAANGEEGVKKAIELLPDIVICDLTMPLKDGYALCEELKTNELTAHLPIILLTAKSAMEAKLKGLRTGADDYLTKPFQTEELLARMTNLVEQRKKLRQLFAERPVLAEVQQEAFLSAQDIEFLRRFKDLLEIHLSDDNLGVEDFAKKMFVSRVQLHRKLKAITNRSATEFIRDFRLERAHAMLMKREGLVGEIAIQVGFGNEKYFSTAFKEKFGVSPSQVQ